LSKNRTLEVMHPRAATAATVALTATAGLFTTGMAVAAEPPTPGGSVFADHCAVCHGPQAAGIPGSFPSLHEQIAAFAKLPQGRDYLVVVVSAGLMGALKVGGVNYNGVMPAQSGLSEAEVAAVLTYLAGNLGQKDSGAPAFTPTEVSAARARHPEASPQSARALRPATDP
jgi:mono/diheme cytochrome c family protein